MRFLLILTAFSFSMVGSLKAQLSGTVFDQDGNTLQGVNLAVAGKYFQTTDSEGRYSFSTLEKGNHEMIVSHSGLESEKLIITITNLQDNTERDIVLRHHAQLLEAVVVRSNQHLNNTTASIGKAGIRPMDMPQSMAIIQQQLIREQQTQKLSEVIRNVNGTYVTTARGSANESFAARGYSLGATNMFKNGLRVNTGSMPETFGLEKVEVLKGSAALLYGNVAPGGIVNMVTKKPKFYQGGEVAFRTGSFGLIKPMIDLFGPLNESTAYRINTSYEQSESFRDEVTSNRLYINPSLLWRAGSKTRVLLQGDFLRQRNTPDFGIGSLADTALSGLPANAFLGTPWQYNRVLQTTGNAVVTHEFNSRWTGTFSAGIQSYDRDYYSTERLQARADGQLARTLNRLKSTESYLTAEANINGKFTWGKTAHQLLAGIDADRTFKNTFNYNNPTVYDTINILAMDKRTWRTDIPAVEAIRKTTAPMQRFGAYVQDLITLHPKIKVLAGLRYTIQNSPAPQVHFVRQDSLSHGSAKYDAAFSPRTGIVYQPTDDLTLFTSYSNSFVINTGIDINGHALDPSLINQFEAGIKNEFFNQRLSVNVTAYLIDNSNLAQTAPFLLDGTPNNDRNIKWLAGKTRSKGVELDIMGSPFPQLQVVAGYSYNDMRFVETPEGFGNYIAGERLVNNPQHTANATLTYHLNTGLLKGLKAGAGAYYTGKRFAGWNNTQGQAQSFSRVIPLEVYTTVDLYFSYALKKFSLNARIVNVTNARNWLVHENYSVNPITPASFITTISYTL